MKKITLLLLLFFVSGKSWSQQSYWQGMGLTFDSNPFCMYYDSVSEKSYLAGNFQTVNGDTTNIMVYDGATFTPMPKAPVLYIRSIIRYKDKLFAAGYGEGLASWDGTSWTLIEPYGGYWNFKIHEDKLYVMGRSSANQANLPQGPIAVWNDTVWTDFLGIDSVFGEWGGIIKDIAFYKGNVYVGGNWYNPDHPDKHDLMMHDGNSWKPVGFFGGDGMGEVQKMLVWRDTLYVAGMFLESPIIPGNSIAAWDGQQWHRLQQGVRAYSTGGGAIDAMTIYNDELWVGGTFYIINGRFVATNYGNVAKWDGSQWCTMGSRSAGTITNFGRWKDELFAVGGMCVDNNMSICHLIKWTGGSYTDTCNQNFTTVIRGGKVDKSHLTIYPNPAKDRINIAYSEPFKKATCSIIDIVGRALKTQDITPNSKVVSIEGIAKGVYLFRIQFDDKDIRFVKFSIE